MPSCQVGGARRSVRASSEKPVIIFRIQVMGLHEPHQMHRVQAAWKPAIGFVDVIADRLCAGDAFIANFDRTARVHRGFISELRKLRRKGFLGARSSEVKNEEPRSNHLGCSCARDL
jgi:hypothetical protein